MIVIKASRRHRADYLARSMLRPKALLPFTCLLALAAAIPPPGSPWASFMSKPVYSRALGPMGPTGMDTISVPYMPKPSMFPKFVDPKAMISKKTDMLSNLFGGLGPVAFNPMDSAAVKPIGPYGSSGLPSDTAGPSDNILFSKKRGIFGPMGPTFGPMGPKFGPMSPKFGPMGPKFGPMGPMFGGPSFSSADTAADYAPASNDVFSRKRRSLVEAADDAVPTDKTHITLGLAPPSLYSKTSAEDTAGAADATPIETLPGLFGPFAGGPFAGGPFAGGPFAGGPFAGGPFAGGPFAGGPFAAGPAAGGPPVGPAVDPSAMMAKKTTFLDTLFKNLATSTAAPPTATDVPVPKSTIVPPSYWLPSSVIPDPSEYTSKVSDFLDKLFDSINLNATTKATDDGSSEAKSDVMAMRSLKADDVAAERTARAAEDISAIAAAKDAVVDAILSELGSLKSDMMTTLNDLIAYEKSATAASAAAKKPFKPPFASMFAPKPVDPTLPFQQRMTVLSQVFDMLTDLQRNITLATNNAIAANAAESSAEESSPKSPSTDAAAAPTFNATLLDAVLKKLSTVVTPTPYVVSDNAKVSSIASRALSKGPTSFWVSYPENGASATAKRQADYSLPYYDDDRHNNRQFTRGVKMQMHQGYQSLPAGSVESVQAGGGSTPGHQGGGIKLLGPNDYGNLNEKWLDWMQYHKNPYQDEENHRHHHNHH